MTLKRISLVFLFISLAGSVFALMILGFNIPWKTPLTPFITLSSFIFAILHAGQREGWAKTAVLAVVVFITGLTFESVGVATGWVYGPYHYTDIMGPKFLGLVPYLIPLAWTLMIYPSMVIARLVTPVGWRGWKRGLSIAVLTGVIMTAWDVVMDPMMVYGGNWVWEVKGAYFGVPLQNFWGWWLTTFAAVGLYLLLTRKMGSETAVIPDRWAIALYIITGITSIITCLIVPELQGAALAGIFAMLPWIIIGWLKTSKKG